MCSTTTVSNENECKIGIPKGSNFQQKMNECKKKELQKSLALFSSKKFCKMVTVAFLFVFDKYCPIID